MLCYSYTASLPYSAQQLLLQRVQENKTLTEQDALLAQHFAAADADRDGRVTFDEFAAYLPAVSTNKARSQLRAALGVEVESECRRLCPPNYPQPSCTADRL